MQDELRMPGVLPARRDILCQKSCTVPRFCHRTTAQTRYSVTSTWAMRIFTTIAAG